MKTSEFIGRLGSRHTAVSANYGHTIKVVDAFYDEMAVISCLKSSDIFLSTNDIELAKLCIEYAETPIAEREEEKRYTVVLPDPERRAYLSVLKKFDGGITIWGASEKAIKESKSYHLTESEIKRNHEYLWQFAKEVTE